MLKKVLWTRSGSPDSEKHFNRRGKNITTDAELFRRPFLLRIIRGNSDELHVAADRTIYTDEPENRTGLEKCCGVYRKISVKHLQKQTDKFSNSTNLSFLDTIGRIFLLCFYNNYKTYPSSSCTGFKYS